MHHCRLESSFFLYILSFFPYDRTPSFRDISTLRTFFDDVTQTSPFRCVRKGTQCCGLFKIDSINFINILFNLCVLQENSAEFHPLYHYHIKLIMFTIKLNLSYIESLHIFFLDKLTFKNFITKID